MTICVNCNNNNAYCSSLCFICESEILLEKTKKPAIFRVAEAEAKVKVVKALIAGDKFLKAAKPAFRDKAQKLIEYYNAYAAGTVETQSHSGFDMILVTIDDMDTLIAASDYLNEVLNAA